MLTLYKKLIVDERGNPTDVVIPWPEFAEISELLGLDLDAEALDDLETARADRQAGHPEAFLDLDSECAKAVNGVYSMWIGKLCRLCRPHRFPWRRV